MPAAHYFPEKESSQSSPEPMVPKLLDSTGCYFLLTGADRTYYMPFSPRCRWRSVALNSLRWLNKRLAHAWRLGARAAIAVILEKRFCQRACRVTFARRAAGAAVGYELLRPNRRATIFGLNGHQKPHRRKPYFWGPGTDSMEDKTAAPSQSDCGCPR